MRIGISSPQDFIALLIRRKWWIIAPFLALSSILAILTWRLPSVYVSTALLLVNQRDVPENMVIDLASGSAESRLKQLEQIILSRKNLVAILDKFGKRLTQTKRGGVDAQIDSFHDDIKIQFSIEKAQNSRAESTINFFRISYQNEKPELAQQVTNELVQLVMNQDVANREDKVTGTTQFLSDERDKVKALLDISAESLKKAKAGKQFYLPENLPTNLKALDRLQLDKQANQEQIERARSHQENIEREITQTPEFLIKVSAAQNQTGRGPAAAAAPAPPKDPLLEDFRKAQDEYDKQAALNKETHPDVQKAKVRLDRAKAKVPPDVLAAALRPPDAPDPTAHSIAATDPNPTNQEQVPNPLYQKLISDRNTANTELAARLAERTFIEKQTAIYEQRVQGTPQVELEIADVARENRDLQRRYEELNGKLSQANLSKNLETAGGSATFKIQDTATFPQDAAKPNRLAVFLGSCLFSLGLSIAFAFAIDVARQRVRSQAEIEAIWGVPVLVDIPVLVTDSDLAALHKQKMRFAMYASIAVALQMAFLFVINLKHVGILQRLDPVLQKLVYR